MVWIQCLKELRQFQRDRFAAALVFLLPIMTMLIFGFAIRLEIKDVPLVIRDYDQTPLSRSYIEQIFATNQFKPIENNNDSTLKLLDQGIARAVIIIPPNFSRKLQQKQISNLQLLIDGTEVNNARAIQSNLRAVSQIFLQEQDLSVQPSNVITHVRIWFNPSQKEVLFIIPGVYGVVLFTYPALVAAMAIVKEKEQGTLVQIQVSDLGTGTFLVGKVLAYVLIAIGEAIILMTLGGLLFALWPVGNPWPLIVGTGIFLMVSVVYGIFIGVYAKTALVAVQNVMNTGLLAAVWLSGFIYPLENIPFPLSLISDLIAVRYYIELTRDSFLVGVGWPRIGYVIPVLIGLMGVMFLVSWRKMKQILKN
ncbi:MAG: ABC transporter permease [Microcystaceae cyanobacterium]